MIRLTIVKPDRQTITIDHSSPTRLTIGRSTSCNICLDFDSQASRLHAMLILNPPEISIKDLNSTNGVVVNGVKHLTKEGTEAEPIPLGDGDQVIIGQTKIKIAVSSGSGGSRRSSTRRVLTTHGKDTRTRASSSATRHIPGNDAVVSLSGSDTDTTQDTVADLQPVFPIVPGWELTRYVATGLTGGVYFGDDKALGKAGAVKTMGLGHTMSRSMNDALRRDADDARLANHPHIARILGAGDIPGSGGAYLAYEYIHGVPLPEFMESFEKGRIPYQVACGLIMQLLDAVCFLHRRDILHMDLKPASVMVKMNDGKPKIVLTDHGFFTFLDSSGIYPRGNPGDKPEKLGFVAPEEINPEAEATPAADVFSLTAIFYYMLTGKYPYRFAPGRDNLKVVNDGWMLPVDEALPELPVHLVVIIERGLSAEPDIRYQTACNLLEAFESAGL